jgi:hypothetical protein
MIEKWDPKDYVNLWIINYRSAEDNKSKLCHPDVGPNCENKKVFGEY